MSKENQPPDAIKDYESLKGKIMKQSRNKGDHIVEANLRDNRAGLDIPVVRRRAEHFDAEFVAENPWISEEGLASNEGV